MAELRTDLELIRDYARSGSDEAFTAIVERHVSLVFATVLRTIKDPQTAEEITQNVFTILARKAPWLGSQVSIAGWLHHTAVLEARAWWRRELRRRQREKSAIEMGTTMKDDDSLVTMLTDELDDALLSLPEKDRQALLLRYFEGRSHREIGALLGAREDAVRMRINKAIERLAQFFRRRGHKAAVLATITALLDGTAKSAPAGLAVSVAKGAIAAGTGGTLGGLHLLLVKWLALPRPQMAALCVAIALVPASLELNLKCLAAQRVSATQALTESARMQLAQAASDIERLRAESARLEAALADLERNRGRYREAALKLQALKQRLHALLHADNQQWPSDLPYLRIPKKVVHSLDLLHHPPGTLLSSGDLTPPAIELFGITAQERESVEKTLANYWHGVKDMMLASAYETNSSASSGGRLTKTIMVPPLGEPLKRLAESTRAELAYLLGDERQKLLFDGWDQGAIQIFWPGNLWKIADDSQTLSAWVDPSLTNGPAWFGTSWSQGQSGISQEGAGAMRVLPSEIFDRFFKNWADQYGINSNVGRPGGGDE